MTDAVLSVRAGPDGEIHVGGVELDGHPLTQVLEDLSCKTLTQVVEAVQQGHPDAAEMPLVLFARDGRTLEADVFRRLDAVAIELHDVSRHVDEADRFARLALQLHRRNRDLQTLYDATSVLGETLDVQALVRATAATLGAYLEPIAVTVTAAGHEGHWRHGPGLVEPTIPIAARPLVTARGELGTVAWWRREDLSSYESQVVEVVLHKAAVAIDHALLLAPVPADAERDDLGLLTPPAARQALAGLVRPYAVALVGSVDGARHLEHLVTALPAGRAGDVKSRWGAGRLLVALAGADVAALCAWLSRMGLGSTAGSALAGWSAGIALVDRDVDAAIGQAADALGRAHRAGTPIVTAE